MPKRQSDLELLRVEMGVLWDLDARGRIRGHTDLAVAIAVDGIAAAAGEHVPDDRAASLLDLATKTTARPGEPPDFVPGLQGGPSYYVEKPIKFVGDIPVLRSDGPNATYVLNMRPGNWEPDEWIDLVNGSTGAPWAMVVHEDRVVSICHTPCGKPAGAEAGTWTDPEFRGRGYAAATTVAWADQLSTPLFYSTSADNYSSQHVAERLGLRPIGWIWKLTEPPRGHAIAPPRRDDE